MPFWYLAFNRQRGSCYLRYAVLTNVPAKYPSLPHAIRYSFPLHEPILVAKITALNQRLAEANPVVTSMTYSICNLRDRR